MQMFQQVILFLPRGLRGDNRTLDRILVENPNELSSLNLNTSLSGKFATGNIKHELLFGVEISRDTFEDKLDINGIGPH